jgi:Sulfotransferase domain
MVKVIGAGLPRTGTTSMKAALERLEFGPCYHMFEILTHPDHVDRWLPAGSSAPVDWDRVFEGYQSTQDWPASHFWRELADAYPEAKVVLTVRDPHRWYVSFRTLITQGPDGAMGEQPPDAEHPVLAMMERLRPLLDGIGRATFGADWRVGLGEQGVPDENLAVAAYHRHVAAVQDSLPAERLLVFDVRQGWEPLCDFLDVEPPAGEPFPHLNDTAALQRMFEQMADTGRVSSPFDVD